MIFPIILLPSNFASSACCRRYSPERDWWKVDICSPTKNEPLDGRTWWLLLLLAKSQRAKRALRRAQNRRTNIDPRVYLGRQSGELSVKPGKYQKIDFSTIVKFNQNSSRPLQAFMRTMPKRGIQRFQELRLRTAKCSEIIHAKSGRRTPKESRRIIVTSFRVQGKNGGKFKYEKKYADDDLDAHVLHAWRQP